MDIAHGGELFDRIGDGPLDEFSAAAIVKNILKALAYLHKQGIMHRDIKPENVLIGSPDGTDVLIADFGEALKADWSDECVGTPQYMAPEVKTSSCTDTIVSKLPPCTDTTACIAISPHLLFEVCLIPHSVFDPSNRWPQHGTPNQLTYGVSGSYSTFY